MQVSFLLLLAAPVSAKKCYALAVAGGGDKGSYEAGVIKGLVERHQSAGNADEVAWDVVTGISAGSNVATEIAMFDKGDEASMATHLVDLVTSFTKDDIYQRWGNWNPVKFLEHSGLVDTSPYYNLLLKVFKAGPAKKAPRKITIGATRDATGELVHFDESMWTKCAAEDFTIKCPDDVCEPGKAGDQCGGANCPAGCKYTDGAQWAKMVRASSAVPGFFETVTINNDVYSDGGVVTGVDIDAAIARCREVVDRDEDIVVDVITIMAQKEMDTFDQEKDNHMIPIVMRAWNVVQVEKNQRKRTQACKAYPNVNWRYYIEPKEKLPSNGLQFDKDAMLKMVQIGHADAMSAAAGQACDLVQESGSVHI